MNERPRKRRKLGVIVRATPKHPAITRHKNERGEIVETRTYRESGGKLRIVAPDEVEVVKRKNRSEP